MIRSRTARSLALLGSALLVSSFALAQTGSSAGASVDLYVAVWGPDGALRADAVVSTRVGDGLPLKAQTLPAGIHVQPGLARKTELTVQHPELGAARFEIAFPDTPRLWVDVAYQGMGSATIATAPPAQTSGGPSGGGPPAGASNDFCETAPLLLVPSLTTGETGGATTDTGFDCGPPATSPGVWYRVVGTGNTITARTCGTSFGFDSKLSVFCGTCADPTCVAGSDDGCEEPGSLLSSVEWSSAPGVQYLILVHGFAGAMGGFELELLDDGEACMVPDGCVTLGACCLPGGCEQLTPEQCAQLGGSFQGLGVACGPSYFDYQVEPCSNAFEDISAFGAPGPVGDDEGLVVPIGFPFRFYGDVHTEVGMSTNGYLAFAGQPLTVFIAQTCPNAAPPDDALFPFWTDLVALEGQTFHATLGAEPNRRFVAQWTDVPDFASTWTATFQVVLHEGSDEIEFRYGQLDNPSFVPVTIGIEAPDVANATCVPVSQVSSFDCLRFTPLAAPVAECCGAGAPLVLHDQEVYFNDLDGSPHDRDGLTNGILTLDGLHMSGVASLVMESLGTIFLKVDGPILLEGSAQITSPPDWLYGSTFVIETCGDLELRDFARIRSVGQDAGGQMFLCVGGSLRLGYLCGIEARSRTEGPLSDGGNIDIVCGEDFRLESIFSYVTVAAQLGGRIRVRTCGTSPDSIRLDGRLLAPGRRSTGRGGRVFLQASQGGMWIPGVDRILATGAAADGEIELTSLLPILPSTPPNVSPDPLVLIGEPGPPCNCATD